MGPFKPWRLVFATTSALSALGCGGATTEAGPEAPPRPTFIVVGARGTVLSSTDATTWKRETSGVSVDLTSIAAGHALFVAVGARGTILTSAEGTTWTSRSSGTLVDLAHVIFTGEQFVAVGGAWSDQAVTLRSSDGATWTALEALPHYSYQAVAFAGGTVFAAAVTPSKKLPMALDNVVLAYFLPSTSNRGGWSERRDLPRFTDSLIVGNETFTAGSWGNESTLSRSHDGESWTTQNLPGLDARSIAFSGSRFVVVGGSSALTSPDAEAWSEPAIPLDAGDWLTGVTYGYSSFVAVGRQGAIFSSPDGGAWTAQVSDSTSDLADAAFGSYD